MENLAAQPDRPVGVPRLELRELSKSFGANHALRDASLVLAPGEIHGLVGENGSGKSTLVKVLSGYHAPDPGGSLLIDGRAVDLPVRPAAMRTFGLSVVHQDLGLIDEFSVVENMRVGSFRVGRLSRAIRWRNERELARASLAELGAEIEPEAPVAGLSPAERAEVAIARALQHHEPGRGLVMFDESTRALPPEPRRHFHSLLRDIVARGGSVLLVSHQLDEVLAHTDRVTVLRDGQVVAAGLRTNQLTEHELIRLMLGRELPRHAQRPRSPAAQTPALVRLENVSGHLVTNASLTVGAGEVVGVTGLLGSGFEELPYLIAGARRAAAGSLTMAGRDLDLATASVRDLLAAGVALVPERRDVEGLAFSETVQDNITLPHVSSRGRPLLLRRSWQREEAARVVRELSVRPADPRMTVGQLSGGNQQKVLLGKWLCGQPRLLVLHEPSQGVDVGARRDLELAIGRVAQDGAGVLLAGMDMTELASVCDRVLVMRDGRLEVELAGPLSPEQIIDAVYGNGGRA
jgi:ribose transport system ATP-binding protein